MGQELSVSCSADCKPECQLQWYKNASTASTGSILHIPKLAKNDNGNYTCRAGNGYGIDANKTLYLVVNCKFKSSIIQML